MPVNDLALTRRRQAALAKLRATTASALVARWDSLGDYSDDTRWTRIATPVLVAGQSRAIDLQVANLQARLGYKLTFDRSALLAVASIDVTEPFVALGRAINAGQDFAAALEAGRARAEGIGESGVQWASRAANHATDDERIVGWTRTLGAGSCEWCVLVSTQTYKSAESASFGHLRCTCGVDPIIGDRNPGAELNAEFEPG